MLAPPPDQFAKEGQNWGFPIYKWSVIEKDHFTWWQKRLQTASLFYDIYRIDHIIGFYRIWAIKRGEKAKRGSYIPNKKWEALTQGETILTNLLKLTDMLPIGEDLGIEVDSIRESMTKLGIPGTRIPRWERNFLTDNSFVPYEKYPQLSLTTLSTHDSETLQGWWNNNPHDAKEFVTTLGRKYNKELTKKERYNQLKESHHTPSLFHINLLFEYLALYPELSWNSDKDDRINIPGTIQPSNWCYRFRPYIEEIQTKSQIKYGPYIEEIVGHRALQETMKTLIQ